MYLFRVSVLLRLYSFYACISPGDSIIMDFRGKFPWPRSTGGTSARVKSPGDLIFMDFRGKFHRPKSIAGTSARDKSPGESIFTDFRWKLHRPKSIGGTSARVKSPGESIFMDFRGKFHRPKSIAGTFVRPKIKESENGQKFRKNNKGSAVREGSRRRKIPVKITIEAPLESWKARRSPPDLPLADPVGITNIGVFRVGDRNSDITGVWGSPYAYSEWRLVLR